MKADNADLTLRTLRVSQRQVSVSGIKKTSLSIKTCLLGKEEPEKEKDVCSRAIYYPGLVATAQQAHGQGR